MITKKFFSSSDRCDIGYAGKATSSKNNALKPLWVRWCVVAASLCLVAVVALVAVGAHRSGANSALLESTTEPLAGLMLTIVDAAPDDAEFCIVNNTEYQVTYGKANRVEKYDGENWVEATTESVGIFPPDSTILLPGQKMYGMCGWVSKNLILEPGTYRYLLVVDVKEPEQKAYPVVLKAEFTIQ